MNRAEIIILLGQVEAATRALRAVAHEMDAALLERMRRACQTGHDAAGGELVRRAGIEVAQ